MGIFAAARYLVKEVTSLLSSHGNYQFQSMGCLGISRLTDLATSDACLILGNFLGKPFSRKQARQCGQHLREVCFCPAALGLRAEREEPVGRAHVKFSSGLRSLGIFAVGCYSILDLMFLPDSEKPLEYGFVNVAHMKGGWC